jgi:thioesterase domain-containing protein
MQPSGSKPPFFCVHPVGGGIMCYAELSRDLGADQPFYALEAIGLDQEQPIQASIEEMAATYIAALQAAQPQGPYFLGGWSFGGTVALEMARQLQQQGQQVALLALFDSWAPGGRAGKQDDATLLTQFIEDIGGISGKETRSLCKRLRRYRPDTWLQHIVEETQQDDGLFPRGTSYAYVQRLFDVYAANSRASSKYQAQPYAAPTLLFRAREEIKRHQRDNTLGWKKLCTTPVEVCTAPGDHYSMLTRPHVQFLAEQLKAGLESRQSHVQGHAGLQPGVPTQEEATL